MDRGAFRQQQFRCVAFGYERHNREREVHIGPPYRIRRTCPAQIVEPGTIFLRLDELPKIAEDSAEDGCALPIGKFFAQPVGAVAATAILADNRHEVRATTAEIIERGLQLGEQSEAEVPIALVGHQMPPQLVVDIGRKGTYKFCCLFVQQFVNCVAERMAQAKIETDDEFARDRRLSAVVLAEEGSDSRSQELEHEILPPVVDCDIIQVIGTAPAEITGVAHRNFQVVDHLGKDVVNYLRILPGQIEFGLQQCA